MPSTFKRTSLALLLAFFSFTTTYAFENIALEGDTTIMQIEGLEVLTSCAGVILDPGGYADYPNDVNSAIVIQPPGATGITLNFALFTIENAFDDFLIFDGSDANSPLIGIYDDMDLQDQTISSTGGAIMIVFTSDFTVQREGFIIDYISDGGTETPIADFSVLFPDEIVLGAPTAFLDQSENAGTWLYDFGDGTQSTEQNSIHTFTEPGTYTVTLTVTGCGGENTSSQLITVQEAGNLVLSEEEICVTLNSFETTTATLTLTNTGAGDLYFNFSGINSAPPDFLSIFPSTGIIAPGSSTNVTFSFSAEDLFAATYIQSLNLNTGNPAQSEIDFLAKMTVIGAPVLIAEPSFIVFNEVILDSPQTDSICIFNIGTDTLFVSDITVDIPFIEINPTDFFVPPGAEFKVNITSTAEEVGGNSGVITILSNAGTFIVQVVNIVVDPPVGSFTPESICLNLNQNESTLFIVGVENTGGEALFWEIPIFSSFPDWLQVANTSGSVEVDSEENIPIIVDATGLFGGEYEYNILVNTNDPINGNEYINVKLNVAPAPSAIFIPQLSTLCSNEIAFINASSNATSFLWNFGDGITSEELSPVHTYSAVGVYEISLTAINESGTESTFAIFVEIESIPFDLEIISSSNAIEVGESVSFSVASNVGLPEVFWQTAVGNAVNINNPTFVFEEEGTTIVSLTGTDINGCQVTVYDTIIVSLINPILEDERPSEFHLFPNPSQGNVNMDLVLKEEADITISLHNMLGQKILSEQIQSISTLHKSYDWQDLKNGIYYVSIWINGDFSGRKEVILLR